MRKKNCCWKKVFGIPINNQVIWTLYSHYFFFKAKTPLRETAKTEWQFFRSCKALRPAKQLAGVSLPRNCSSGEAASNKRTCHWAAPQQRPSKITAQMRKYKIYFITRRANADKTRNTRRVLQQVEANGWKIHEGPPRGKETTSSSSSLIICILESRLPSDLASSSFFFSEGSEGWSVILHMRSRWDSASDSRADCSVLLSANVLHYAHSEDNSIDANGRVFCSPMNERHTGITSSWDSPREPKAIDCVEDNKSKQCDKTRCCKTWH